MKRHVWLLWGCKPIPRCNYCNYQIRLFETLLNRYTSGGSKKLAAFEAVVFQICDWWKWQFFLKVTSLCCCCGNANNLKLWKGRIAKEFRDFATCDLDLHSNPAQILLKLWTDFVANCQKILLNCEKDYLSVERASFQEMLQRFCWNEASCWGD